MVEGQSKVHASDVHGAVALMLCESLLHVLVEEGILPRQKVLEAIEGVAEVAREIDERGTRRANIPSAGLAAMTLVQMIAESFAAKEQTPDNIETKRSREGRRARGDRRSGKD